MKIYKVMFHILFVILLFSPSAYSKKPISNFKCAPFIKDIQLDRLTISERDKERLITVSIELSEREGPTFTYSYSVSAGKVNVTGTEIKWDLTGVPVKYPTEGNEYNAESITVRAVNSKTKCADSRTAFIEHDRIKLFGWVPTRRRPNQPAPEANSPADVEKLTLDTNEIVAKCQSDKSQSASCSDSFLINISTEAFDKEGDALIYSYNVSAGRIIGRGAGVLWDLSGVKPGTYTITTAVDDGCGFCGKTMTKTVKVVECPDCKSPQ